MTTIGTSYNVAPNTSADNVGIPIGTMLMWATATAPTNYLICNGSAVSRSTYAPLFAVLGTTWGVGDGTTTFNLPNTAGRVIRGVNGTYTLAGTGGADTQTLIAQQLPDHTHGVYYGGGTALASGSGQRCGDPNVDIGVKTFGTYTTAGASLGTQQAVSIVEPWVGVNYIIKFA